MKLAILMDPLETIKPYKDTSIGLMKRAQEMGWTCAWFTPSDLFCKHGKAFASMHSLFILNENTHDWYKTEPLGIQSLSDYDIILMRKDPPFNQEYIYATYALDLAVREGVLVSNAPNALRSANEKFFTLHFPDCCPETLVSKTIAHLHDFWEKHREVIFKPLEGMGGKSVFYVDASGKNLPVILEMLTAGQTVTIMAQKYIPDILETGDKRILLIDGEPVPFALARIPALGDLRGNLAAGASAKVVPITKRDQWIAQQIAPVLRQSGLHFVGIDVIGDYLTEINVTSPTCLREISNATDLDLAGNYLNFLAKKVSE